MDRKIAFILAGACVALGFGGYLMSNSFKGYDLNTREARVQARVERIEKGEKPGLIAALLSKYSQKLETARNQYLGEHFPKTPEGWVIAKTHHDEIVDFTVDYKLHLTLNDMSSVRRLSGAGMSQTIRSTDVAFRKDDKVIFLRLSFANGKREKPLGASVARLFIGTPTSQEDIDLQGLRFKRSIYGDAEVINLYATAGHYTAIGVLSNAPMADVERLLKGMDLFAFGSLVGNPKGGSGYPLVAGATEMATAGTDGMSGAETVTNTAKPSPKGNMLDGLTDDSEEPAEADKTSTAKKRRNLLSSLLGAADDELEIRKGRKNSKTAKSEGSSFKKVGNFTSRCKQSSVGKLCRVEN